ncbi:MAG TPA: pilus assembly protein TadG-related protein [Clostridia bacterium]|nr:pilus assembly protein TadG-related protein [Clostridia bacterium]
MKDKINNEKGIAMVMVVIAMVVIIGFAALAVDFGNATVRKSRLQNACDAAALAGAQKWAMDSKSKEDDDGGAGETAEDIFEVNIDSNIPNAYAWSDDFTGSETGITANVVFDNSAGTISVYAKERMDTFFAGIFGMNQMEVNTKAVALIGTAAAGVDNLMPFGIEEAEFDLYESIILRTDKPSTPGNFHLVDFDKIDDADWDLRKIDGSTEHKIAYHGSINEYSVGQMVNTEPGKANSVNGGLDARITGTEYNPASNSEYEYEPVSCETTCGVNHTSLDPSDHHEDCPRFVIVPIIENFDEAEGRDDIKIVGFASIFITDYNNNEIEGKFVERVVHGDVDPGATFMGTWAVDFIE